MPRFAWLLVVVTLGCAGMRTQVVNGTTLDQARWVNAAEKVKTSAAFEINCPRDQLELVLLDSASGVATKIGVTGCERRLVYVDRNGMDQWVLNSSDGAVAK